MPDPAPEVPPAGPVTVGPATATAAPATAEPFAEGPAGAEALPLGVELSPTGHPAVDAGLARLAALDGVPTDAHVAVYEDVHQRLTDTLAALDRE
ncbi:hypothetical protein OH807_29890 [Kitasatospora sp. NBC_01560]|uniref:hypothetical protein n=1 Tax=Kitasatospora sp. NBC_01560 TaxID=2975965 RepID=UPI00386487F5